jgi:hypothetical protein
MGQGSGCLRSAGPTCFSARDCAQSLCLDVLARVCDEHSTFVTARDRRRHTL